MIIDGCKQTSRADLVRLHKRRGHRAPAAPAIVAVATRLAVFPSALAVSSLDGSLDV